MIMIRMMSRKTKTAAGRTLKLFLLTALFLTIAVPILTAQLTAQSIVVDSEDLQVDAPDSLKRKLKEKEFDPAKLRKKLVEALEDHFLANGLPTKKSGEYYDFQLKGTVEVEDHLARTHGFFLVFSTHSMRIVPAKKNRYLPELTFMNISGSNHPQRDSSHSTSPKRAVENGIRCFVEQMQETGIFYFPEHPLYKTAVYTDEKKMEDAIKGEDLLKKFSLMLATFKKEIRKTVRVEMKAVIKAIKSGSGKDNGKDYGKEIKGIWNGLLKLDQLVRQKSAANRKDFDALFNMIRHFKELLDQNKIDEGMTDHIVVYITVPPGLPEEFKKTVIRPATRKNTSYTDIDAKNIKQLSRWKDIELLKQNQPYGHCLTMEGEVALADNTVIITLPEASFNKIFEINANNNLEKPGELMNSIEYSGNVNPRLFIMDKKERKKRIERKEKIRGKK